MGRRGTYQMRVRHGAPVAPQPKDGALVTEPGPLLCDVQAELGSGMRAQGRDVLRDETAQMIDEVRAAVASEATELCAHAELDFEHRNPESAQNHRDTSDADAPTAAPVAVRHRFSRPRDGADAAARRIIVLRDRRRGRPPRHGADPPG